MSKRVLIIDDEMDFVKMLKARLQIEGYEVLVAEDGAKGLQKARRELPDLIILDIMMPGMDGHMVADMLKKSTLTWAIPLIYLTARTGQDDESLAMDKGAKFYLTKPYNPEMLLEMVKSALLEHEEVQRQVHRILAIDTDLAFVDELGGRLRQAGYEVFISATAEQGLKAASEVHPDIILIDLLTSRQDGHVSVKKMDSDEALRHIPLFILAPQSVIEKLDPKTVNLDKFISKPMNYTALLDKLATALKMKKG